MTWNTFINISIIYLLNHIAYGENNAPAGQTTTESTLNIAQMQKQTNRFLAQFFRKYGSRGTISFEVSISLNSAVSSLFSERFIRSDNAINFLVHVVV